MRIRLPELLTEHKMTAYALAVRLEGRVGRSTIYRLRASKGRAPTFDADLLEALCDVFGVGPDKLLEREPKKRGRG